MSIQIGAMYKFKVVRVESNYSIIEDSYGITHYYNNSLPKSTTIGRKIGWSKFDEIMKKYAKGRERR